jgi:hypothetical protein
MIEPGWEVVDAAGEQIGTVEEVEGDPDSDIFNGLRVATGLLGKADYVPAERVGEISEGTVRLSS